MITLTPEQEDALIEIANVGVSKAAKQLAILLNSPIKITIPKISFIDLNEIKKDPIFNQGLTYSLVSQMLETDLEGYAALLLRREYANLLTMAVVGKIPEFTREEALAYEQEAMLEIGNIIITSCISVIANMLNETVQLSVPVYNEDKLVPLLTNLCALLSTLNQKYIAITTKLDTSNNSLSGHLFLILTESSVARIVSDVRKLIGS
jgi:chemotaxis protein CheC